MTEKSRLDHISIVLHKPRFPENIGAAVRSAKNMGIGRVIVVDPANFDLDKIRMMATHAASDMVEGIEVFTTLKQALGEYTYVVGTTARLGKERSGVSSPAQMARKLVSISQENRVAVVFGPEDRGLVNEELRLCHQLVNIPTADFSSINLAQAVMILCYEIFSASIEKDEAFVPRLASRYELDGMYDQLKDILVRIDYIKPDNPDYWMYHIRRFFSRIGLRAGEVAIIRGICRQVDWYGKKCRRDGICEAGGNNDNPII
jgi:tRNA/rRNA methyltransferase